MLYEIEKLPAAHNSAILLNPADNVAIARVPLSPGQEIEIAGRRLRIQDSIPAGHKFSLEAVSKDEPLRRYANVIGFASAPIAPGRHVHTHNLSFREIWPDADAWVEPPATARASQARTFLGYLRPDGRVGTRNYIAVVAASNCAAYTAELIARSFEDESLPETLDGVVAFPHGEGCGQSAGADTAQLQRTLLGVLDHPNVAAALILGLGCEVNQIGHYLGRSDVPGQTPAALHGLTLQESGGTRGALSAARQQIHEFIERAAAQARTPQPAAKLVLGLNCGGSDSFSGITANPALGHCCDLLVAQGGTVALAETTEIFGAEHLLVERARTPELARRLLETVKHYKAYLQQFGGSFDDNPSPGNKEGGLTNILEKSLGAIAKAGSSSLEDVVEYAGRLTKPGLAFMDTPGYDPVSLTGLAAGGVNLIAFTTGRGSAIGFGSIPVLKIASNSRIYRNMSGNMDINAGRIADGEASVEQVGSEIFEALLRTASGEKTKAEQLGHHEFAPWRIGPVL